MHIWLMRHAEAVSADEAPTDFDRKLTHAGRKQAAHLGRWLKEHEARPDRILHSPLKRACETAEILRDELGKKITLDVEPLMAPGMNGEVLLRNLAARTDQIVICVGHQPDIGRCLTEMVGGGRFSIPAGAMAAVEFSQVIVPRAGQLRWLLNPNWF
jgi:phosphohistidine phosphatase